MKPTITNHPELLQDGGELVAIRDVSRRIAGSPSELTVRKWMRIGRNGVILRSLLVGRRRYTTTVEITRWITAMNEAVNRQLQTKEPQHD